MNPVKLAARFVESLPADSFSPETTEGREGFAHPYRIEGDAGGVTVTLILRDHDGAKLEEHDAFVRRLAEEAVADEPRATVAFERWDQYRNMGEALEASPTCSRRRSRRHGASGSSRSSTSIRGGTDGSRLTEMGLPTPNIFTGGNEYHSVREWISVQDLAISAATVVELLRYLARDLSRRARAPACSKSQLHLERFVHLDVAAVREDRAAAAPSRPRPRGSTP